MSTFVNFVPSTTTAFQFQPTLGLQQYIATITWNIFGQRYYLNLTDLNGNLIICEAIDGASGPRIQAQISRVEGTATVVAATPHNVPVGSVAAIRITQTGTNLDGSWQALAIDSLTLTFPITDTGDPMAASGTLDFPINLVGAVLDLGFLYYHEDLQQFEYA